MELIHKEKDFFTYCKTCKHEKLEEYKSPCNECLEEGVSIGEASVKPVMWEEK